MLRIEEMIADILDTLPVGVALIDKGMRVQYLNPRLVQLSGYSLREAAGIDADFVLRTRIGDGPVPTSLASLVRQAVVSGDQICRKGTLLNRRRRILAVNFTISRISAKPAQAIIVVEEAAAAGGEQVSLPATRLIGNSLQMEKVLEKMAIFARTDAAVLITGETGCGKDLLAEELHNSSQRARHPFIKVNCGALPESLLESELFGHKRGAFTGAEHDHPGMFRLANRGTLFLTEIGDLSLPLQVKLLSVLDDHKFFPVGSTAEVRVDIRLIAATHRNLRQDVAQGRFRQDLFFRLNVLHLEIPPLRERREDLRLLTEHFLQQTAHRIRKKVQGLDKETVARLYRYHWPGNVRELRNAIEYAVNMCRGKWITPEDLPEHLLAAEPPVAAQSEVPPTSPEEPPVKATPQITPLAATWQELEKQQIINALQQTGGHKAQAAKLLGMGRTTLWRKIGQYSIDQHD